MIGIKVSNFCKNVLFFLMRQEINIEPEYISKSVSLSQQDQIPQIISLWPQEHQVCYKPCQ